MGAVKTDLHVKERTLDAKYLPVNGHALDSADGLRILLSDYHALVNRQYMGDYDAVVILIDLATAIAKAGLTDKQRTALALVYGEDLTQEEAGKRLICTKQTVNRLINIATVKIARIYEYWARHGEGYSITPEEETE
jgi:DNA-directed RNA polymerase specialized sigma subunit